MEMRGLSFWINALACQARKMHANGDTMIWWWPLDELMESIMSIGCGGGVVFTAVALRILSASIVLGSQNIIWCTSFIVADSGFRHVIIPSNVSHWQIYNQHCITGALRETHSIVGSCSHKASGGKMKHRKASIHSELTEKRSRGWSRTRRGDAVWNPSPRCDCCGYDRNI